MTFTPEPPEPSLKQAPELLAVGIRLKEPYATAFKRAAAKSKLSLSALAHQMVVHCMHEMKEAAKAKK